MVKDQGEEKYPCRSDSDGSIGLSFSDITGNKGDNPKRPPAGFFLEKASAEAEGSRPEAALDTLQNGLFVYPKSVRLLRLLGNAYERNGQTLKANDAYIRALRYSVDENDRNAAANDVSRIKDVIKRTRFSKADYVRSLYKVASIYCYGRSGTLFLKSLLDNHPETIVTMLSGIKILNLWEEIKDSVGKIPQDFIVDRIFETLHTEFNDGRVYDEAKLNGMYVMGENRDRYYSIDKNKFKEEFIDIVDSGDRMTARFFYQAIQYAASRALGRNYDFTKGIPVIIEGGIHFGSYADLTRRFIDVFPYTKFIQMIRNPVDSVASTVRSLARSGNLNIGLLASNLVILLHRVPELEEWVSRTYLIRLEDLHTMPRETLQLLCGCLNVDWNDSLLSSTFGGIKWWNSITSETLSGFNTRTISKSCSDVLSSFDAFRFECLLRVKFKAWGYPSFGFFDYEIMKKLLDYPFRFEKMFAADEAQLRMNRKILKKNIVRYLNEENNFPDDERYEYDVRLLTPAHFEEAL